MKDLEYVSRFLQRSNQRDRLVIKMLTLLALTPEQICSLYAGNYDAKQSLFHVPLVNRPGTWAWVPLPKIFAAELTAWLAGKLNSDSLFPNLTEDEISRIARTVSSPEGEVGPEFFRSLIVDQLLMAAAFGRFHGSIEDQIRMVDVYNDLRDTFVATRASTIEEALCEIEEEQREEV